MAIIFRFVLTLFYNFQSCQPIAMLTKYRYTSKINLLFLVSENGPLLGKLGVAVYLFEISFLNRDYNSTRGFSTDFLAL